MTIVLGFVIHRREVQPFNGAYVENLGVDRCRSSYDALSHGPDVFRAI
jgi:hypothetical protein